MRQLLLAELAEALQLRSRKAAVVNSMGTCGTFIHAQSTVTVMSKIFICVWNEYCHDSRVSQESQSTSICFLFPDTAYHVDTTFPHPGKGVPLFSLKMEEGGVFP